MPPARRREWLLRRCLNEYGEYGQSVCTGYIYASIDASTKDCRPAGVTYSILMRVVVAYLRNHPEKLHMNAAMLGADAMAKAYPWPRQTERQGRRPVMNIIIAAMAFVAIFATGDACAFDGTTSTDRPSPSWG